MAKFPAARIVVWGFSLGGGVAVQVAAKYPIAKLILEAPYTSTADVASSIFPIVPTGLLMKDQFHSDRYIGNVSVPILFMHGVEDQAISIRLGEKLFSLAHEPKKFVRFPPGRHENLDDYGAVAEVHEFIMATKP